MIGIHSFRASRVPFMAAAVALLAGCATFSEDGGFGPVERTARERLGKELVWAKSGEQLDTIERRVAELLAQPLSADAAVQVALLNNRGLQASLQELGIAEAELVQLSRLPNPGFSFGRFRRGDEREIERSLHVNLARLIALPLLRPIEERRFAVVQGSIAMEVLSLASQARKAWTNAVAAEQTVLYRRQVQSAADASAELARRMREAGNFNRLQLAREQAFYSDAVLNLARAEQAQLVTRESLTRLLGLWGAQTRFTLPERLPDLPGEAADRPSIEQEAIAQRLDLQAARLGAEALANNLGLTRVTRFVNVLELSGIRESSNEEPRRTGYELDFEIPLFDWSGARVARAEAIYMQALHRAAQLAVDARSEVREAYGAYRSSWDIARHYRDEVVPNAKRISDENLLRYNGMLIGVFELLADARAQIASVSASIEALRDFWIANADLELAVIGKPSLSALPAAAMSAAEGAAAGAPH